MRHTKHLVGRNIGGRLGSAHWRQPFLTAEVKIVSRQAPLQVFQGWWLRVEQPRKYAREARAEPHRLADLQQTIDLHRPTSNGVAGSHNEGSPPIQALRRPPAPARMARG